MTQPNFPPNFLESLQNIESFNKPAFQNIHSSGELITSIRVNPYKVSESQLKDTESWTLETGLNVPWCNTGYYLAERPSFTFDPLFHAGCYYVQEASSMFLEQALKQTVDLASKIKVLDISAAPGGKSTHILSLISKESLLVANEVIRSRANILKENIIKWGVDNVIVTNNDPSDFINLENYFDVIVIDAPCSGSGLFRRDPEAMNEWSQNNVALCSQRQQRILADILPALKEDGILVYSTCSYSEEENEQISDWLMQSFPLIYRPLTIEPGWGITDTGKGYRFWPDKVKGEGFFISCFQKTGKQELKKKRARQMLETLNAKESGILSKWIDFHEAGFFKYDQTVYAWRISLQEDFNFLLNNLRVINSGINCGELMKDKLIPSHNLAMSMYLSESVEKLEINYQDAIHYLQRKTPVVEPQVKGWQVVTYKKFVLGWINALPQRINNYYPKELRIIKDN